MARTDGLLTSPRGMLRVLPVAPEDMKMKRLRWRKPDEAEGNDREYGADHATETRWGQYLHGVLAEKQIC